ncbi:MAG: polyribonucleotide nucleotidyltransferase, partial [Candidatus Omnitrophica bacterium]|nr:polyribonucleotide nucleotidyltransferase [Candidatus Omnitrophota bacterium]
FPEGYCDEVQVMATVLSVDADHNPDTLAMIGGSTALMISSVPFHNPVGSVRVGQIDGQFVLNPTFGELATSELELILAATKENVVMIEAGASEVSEETFLKAIEFGHQAIQSILKLQEELLKKCGKTKEEVSARVISKEVSKKVHDIVGSHFLEIFNLPTKSERETAHEELYEKVLAAFDITDPNFKEGDVKFVFSSIEEKEVRKLIVEKGKRPDGRGFQEIRPISCEVGILPRTHGSSLFTRGETQSLSIATLGSGSDEQRIDALEGEQFKRFMLHYNFPPFSVGEIAPNRGPGRREIGHGALAERALRSMIPSQEEFPYTIRLVSEILESNGSSSMASVCAGTLALMDAGVPIQAPVSGIAMGLVTEGKSWKVLTDIAGIEDHLGDMDFKVAGTQKGITAVQMDIKISGITNEILKKALEDARVARLSILDTMLKTIPASRKDLSTYAPRIVTLKINPDKIGGLIGPGGKVIKRIIAETGAKVDIEDDGRVHVSSSDPKAAEAAIAQIKAITEEAELGKIYQATVRKIMPFGAFCEILPGMDGLLHVSEIKDGFVKKVEEHLSVGDVISVKVIQIDDNGKISLSRKKALEEGQKVAQDGSN